MRLSEYRVGQQHTRFWLEWDRGIMNVRDLTIKLTSYTQYIDSREWARKSLILPALVCVAPDIAQERRMQRGSGQTHIFSRSDGVDNHQYALERARATRSYLVAEQSSSTVGQFAQTMLVRCDSR